MPSGSEESEVKVTISAVRGEPGLKSKKLSKETNKKGKEKKEQKEGPDQPQEENPLLFFQLSDLVRGISQSVRAVMTNVDERFEYKRTDPAEIVQALQLLQEFTSQNFPSLCKDLEERSLGADLELYKAIGDLREDLERAGNGAKQGLAALKPGSR